MAVHLCSLRNVDEAESEALQQKLDESGIEYYQTPAGSWGISAAALWLRNREDAGRAKQVLQVFQQDWSVQQRAHHAELKQSGQLPGFLDLLKQQPVKVIVYLGLAVLILYLSTKPFLSIGG